MGPQCSPGEEIGYPLQYSWASLLAQLAKNPPAMQMTWVQSLSWEDPLEEGMATHSSILSGESHGQRHLAGYMGSQRVRQDCDFYSQGRDHSWQRKNMTTC